MYKYLKRTIDLVLAVFLLVVFSPMIVIISMFIIFSGDGPVFHLVRKVGKDGREINVFNFRTMINSEPDTGLINRFFGLVTKKRNELRSEDFVVFALRADPRISPTGRFLRKTGLYSIPQLINIILGEMSFIGPQPLRKFEYAEFYNKFPGRFSVVPGLISYGNLVSRNSEIEAVLVADEDYCRSITLKKDFGVFVLMVRSLVERS